MLKILGYGLLALLVAVVALVAYAATKPDNFRIERSLRIAAPPDKLWPLISDLRGFNRWNPFAAKDPGSPVRYGASTSGPGASFAWDSPALGAGSMEIVEALSPTQVRMKLDFIKPFEAHNQAIFTLRADGDATEVRWAMEGPAPLLNKVMDVVFNMDRMVGTDFEAGLATLKTLAEKP